MQCPFILRFYVAAVEERNERLAKLKSDGSKAFYKKVVDSYFFPQIPDALLVSSGQKARREVLGPIVAEYHPTR